MLAVAAGLLRRDQMMLTATPGESWHNHAHDLVSALIYVALASSAAILQRIAVTLPLALLTTIAVRLACWCPPPWPRQPLQSHGHHGRAC